ncbi:hypothetical protein [Pseudovibrio sp. Tun.PSC04-5.I4]|uniref:hypothetical protein n=1 Tax=Pseudovibrio sp. Tun.PSC04-5.I4 TaxID=1798213 RepID=UPI0008903C7A|nr:hypothetical protein [Pseudovibrio sp. Tun.PSC04-5.I4]SDR45743.1 hypothetical protein SAMN04515695_5629 [Pseudovibrio sp. Tun.PSC04-5.I4]
MSNKLVSEEISDRINTGFYVSQFASTGAQGYAATKVAQNYLKIGNIPNMVARSVAVQDGLIKQNYDDILSSMSKSAASKPLVQLAKGASKWFCRKLFSCCATWG